MKEALLKYCLASQGLGMPGFLFKTVGEGFIPPAYLALSTILSCYNHFRAFFFQITYNPSRISVSR